MAKRKALEQVTAKCSLCDHFFHSNLTKNGQIHNPRQCRAENREIHSIDPVCENFELAPYFYCDNSGHQINIPMCHNRVARKMEECRKCRQRAEVLVAEALSGAIVPQTQAQRVLKVRANITIEDDEPDEPVESNEPDEPVVYVHNEPRRILKRRVCFTE